MTDKINLENAHDEDLNTSKNLLLRGAYWNSDFNNVVKNIRKKIEDKNSKFYEERSQIKNDLLTYATPSCRSSFRSEVEEELLVHWCKNVLIVLQLAEFPPHSFDHILKCVTYNKNFQKQSGVGHASEAQYAFTMLMDLDGK